MSRTAAKTGKGTQLWYAPDSSGVPGTYVKIAELTSVDQPEITAGSADATHYESDSSVIEKISSGWKDSGEMKFVFNWVKTQVSTVRGIVGTEQWFKIVYPSASTDIFYGMISGSGGGEIPNKETLRNAGKILPMGPITFTA